MGRIRLVVVVVVVVLLLATSPLRPTTPDAVVGVSMSAPGYQGQADVAADPANPDALVVVGADDGGAGPTAWSSADGGASWTAVTLPLTYDSTAFDAGGEPAVAVDRDGTWYATYEVHDLDMGNPVDSSLVVARSFDGLVWEALAIVDDNRGAGADPGVETPHIAVDLQPSGCTSYSGRIQLVWVRSTAGDRAIYRTYSSNGGSTWAGAAKINDGVSGGEDVWRPRIAVGPDGDPWVAWLDDLQKTVVVDRSTNGGASYGTDVNAASVTLGCGGGDCGIDPGCSGGALHGSTPEIAVDTSWTPSRGAVYVGFADESGADGLDVWVTASVNGGATWSSPVRVHSDATRQQYGPSLAVHPSDGSVHAAWYDRRADAAGPDCATETWHALSTDGGATWTDETAISTGASDYTGDPRGEGAHSAIAATGGRVYPTWTDRTGVDHEIALARISYIGGTVVPGQNISVDTTWFAADGPFLVTGDQKVEPGVTLTIEADTQVRFATCDDRNRGIDAGRIEMVVEGILDVQGGSGTEVTLESAAPTPGKQDWYGLRFQNTADSSDSTLTHAIVRHTSYGVRLTSSSPTLEDVTIEQAQTNGIQGSARNAVPFSPTRVTVNDAGTAVSLSGVSGTWTDVTLENSSGGAGSIGGGNLDLRLVGMTVANNLGGGLAVNLNGGGLEVILSDFTGNGAGEAGLNVDGAGPRTLVSNDFSANTGDGLELDNDSSGLPVVAAYYNNFVGNGVYAVRMEPGSLPADARRSHWGALDGQMGGYPANVTGIFDIHDVDALRHVDFRDNQPALLSNDVDLQSYLAVPTSLNDNETVIRGGAVAREGVMRVEVSTDGGMTWADATVEGASFSYFWAPAPGVYTVQSRVTDMLGAVEATPDQVIVTVSSGPTLAGTMLADETWTGGTPIVLEGDVVVPAGVTLTIDPGTVIHSQFLTDASYGGLDPSRIEIIVQGVLISNGTSGSRVTWDSSRASTAPEKGDWYGIRYLDTTTDTLSIVQNTDISHGVNGIKLEDAAPDVIDSSISNCSNDGLAGDSGSLAKALWILDGNTVQDNDGDGIDVTGDTEVRVDGAVVTGNGGVGVDISASPYVVTVFDATITGNGGTGLSVASGSTGFNLFDSTIDGNGGDGVFVSSGGTDIRLERLNVTNNAAEGVEVASGTTLTLLKSTISGNERGLRIGAPRLIGAYNSITGNTGDMPGYDGAGIEYYSGTGTPAVIGMSDIDSVVDYEVYLTTSRALNARRNHWGATTTTAMNGAGFPADLLEFRDINEDRATGVVDYDNWATASVAGSAPGDRAAHITWPGDGASLERTSVVVTGVAYALDGIDRVEVCARQAADPVCGDGGGETPFGVVTGKEAWTFEWFPAATGTWFLEARVVDENQVKSTPTETIAYAVTLPGPTLTGPVEFSGPIIADQTWSGDIELTGDVVVEAGSTLTVQAGTTVSVRALADDRLGGEDTSRIELIVRGNLVTQGTGGSPILLTSTRIVPERRDWYGVRFEETSDASLNDMDRTTIEGGWHGIEFRDTFSALDEVSAQTNHRHGLYLSNATAAFPATATVTGGSFTDNGSYGVYLFSVDGTWLLDGVEIGDNDSYGMYVFACNNDGPFTMNGLDVHTNVTYGVYFYSCAREVNLVGSSFDANAGNGYYALQSVRDNVRANNFTNNAGTALTLANPGEPIVSKNSFSGNEANLWISDSGGATTVVFNDFGPWTEFNEQNVEFSSGAASAARNLHFNNLRQYAPLVDDVALRNAVAAGVNARVNYWDPDTTAEMNGSPFPSNITSIEDVEDNMAWGRVDWRAHRAVAVDLSPPQVCGFTSPVDGDMLTGVAFTLRGAAAADAGIALVEISTDGGSTWNPAVGAEVWTYQWTPPGSGNYDLTCRVTDQDAMVQALPATINVDVNAASITTSGTLTGDETWSGVVVLTGDVTVPAGITLTIAPGTEVRSTPQSDDQFSGVDTSRIELIIEGTLDLQGTGVSPVTFTSDRTLPAVPTAGDWYGIRLTDTADSTVSIHDAVIEAGVRGIWGTAGSHHDVTDCVIRDMNEDGIFMQFGGSPRDVADPGIEIAGNTVERTGTSDYGIYLSRTGSDASWNDAVHRISDNTVDDTGSYGLYVYTAGAERTEVHDNVISTVTRGVYVQTSNTASYTNRVEVMRNQVTDASSYALYTYIGRDVAVDDNVVVGGGRGLYVYNPVAARIVRNDFSGGSSDGILLSSSGSAITLHRNSVSGYARDALSGSGFVSLVALYNTFDGAGDDGVSLSPSTSGAPPRLFWNNVQGSGVGHHDATVSNAIGADMRHNYWDTTNVEMIAAGYPADIDKIEDIEDAGTRGRIDYRALEAAPVATGGTLESRFVWPFDGDSMSRRTITLEGSAYADPGVALVEVSTDGGATWLPAAGTDFWTFSFTPVVDGPQEFRCRVTDVDSNVEVTPDVITVTFDSSLPTTEGTLPGDETWTAVSPILLTGDIVVPFGTTLTIEPGATLLVQPLADNGRGGVDLSRIELIVEGTLDLQGTAMSPVSFGSSRAPSPLAGDWFGIRLTDTADSAVTIHDLVVEHGVRGIWGQRGSHHDVLDCIVRDMTDSGIYMEFGDRVRDGADPGLTLTGNTVERTGSNDRGIHVYRRGSEASWNTAVHEVNGNVTDDTGSHGIYVYGGNAERIEASGNIVSNATYGVYLQGSTSVSYANRLEMTGNQVTDASQLALYAYIGRDALIADNVATGGGSGVYTYNLAQGRVVNNTLDGGTGDGIYLSNNSNFSNMTVHRNVISNYGDDGIVSSVLKSLTALYNSISNVGGDALDIGVSTVTSPHHVNWNNIQGSSGFDARLTTATGFDARRNFWAGTNAEMLAEGYPAEISEIEDIADVANRGRVDYRGVETTAVVTAVSLESRIVWPFDGDTLSGAAIQIDGTAYADDGVQFVEVSLDGGSTWLPATGADAWSFAFTPSATGPVEIRSRVTDTNSVVEATPDVITVNFDLALPTLDGVLTGDETWSGPGPFVLTGDVVVPAGTTLTIAPGTTIQVQALADNRRTGVDTSRIELIVEGTLVAQGSGPGSIVVTSASMTPEKGHWYGIRYDGVPRPLTELRDMSLQWAVRGLSETNGVGVPDLDGLGISQMTQNAIHTTTAPTATGIWSVRNLDVSFIDQVGVILDTGTVDADVLIEDVTIQDVGRTALDVDMTSAEDLVIRDSTFHTASSNTTLDVYGPHDALLERVAVSHPSASGYGFYMGSSHVGDTLTIDDSEITGGSRSIYLYRVSDSVIKRNLIAAGGDGVYLFGYSVNTPIDVLLENNRISDMSGDGVEVGSYVVAELHYNDLFNIGGYALNNQSTNDVDAADNYWGEDTESEMDAKGCTANIDAIYDQYDNGTKGLVTYCDYATNPFGDQPILYFDDDAGADRIRWNPKADLTYDLIRGDLANLVAAGATVDLGTVVCQTPADSSGDVLDASPDPAAGQAWFFLLRDHTTPGTYGIDSAGRVRLPSAGDCP